MYIRLSDRYCIRNEANCSYLIAINQFSAGSLDAPVILLPPFVGYILSMIGSDKYHLIIPKMATSINVNSDAIDTFIKNLRAGGYRQLTLSDQNSIIFPSDLLIESNTPDSRVFFTSMDFNPCDEFHPHRPSIPFNLNLMVTTLCTTNCIYCYACRDLGENLTTDQLCTFIAEAKKLGVINISLTGGDIFAMPNWHMVLSTLIANGYKSFISTKTPLSIQDLLLLKELGVTKFQFSLDSIDANVLTELLHVGSSYIDNVLIMLNNCDALGIKVQIRSVLTKINSTQSSLTNILNTLLCHKCICEWDITPAFFSAYKTEYEQYSVPNDDLIALYKFRQDNTQKVLFPIMLNKVESDGYCLQRYETCEEFVNKNQRCIANVYGLSVLASGDCTICEMLYQNPEYLLGNIIAESLEAIWNSPKALKLYHPEPFEDETTPCSTCIVFDKCKQSLEKRVCYVDIAKVNGENSFIKPDPRCPKAPTTTVLL